MVEEWFKPKRHSGFRKARTVDANLRVMYLNADKRMTRKNRYLRVGRQALALANVTPDKATEKKAKAVSKKAFKRAAAFN